MRKQLLKVALLCGGVLSAMASMAQTRYVDDVFADYTKSAEITYDSNRSMNILFQSGYPIPSVNNSPFITANLKCNVYSPAGDSLTSDRKSVV